MARAPGPDPADELPANLHRHRMLMGMLISVFIGIGAITAPTLVVADGEVQSSLIRCGFPDAAPCDVSIIARIVVLLGAAIATAFITRDPHNPDVAITRNVMVAIGVIGIVVGLTEFITAVQLRDATTGTAQPIQLGIAALALPLGGALAAYTGLRRGIWPPSRMAQGIEAANRRH